MSKFSRRKFIQTTGIVSAATAATGIIGCATTSSSTSTKTEAAKAAPRKKIIRHYDKRRVVVIGGGYGGAITAKYIKLEDPSVEVKLIDQNANYVSCPLSNEVLSGDRDIESLTFNYSKMSKNHGVEFVHNKVVEINAEKRFVKGQDGSTYYYDKLVVSPGVSYKWDAFDGYSEEVANTSMPHAWKAGAQTTLLRKQLLAMKDGGVCYISAPPNPFRCPPGPYERAAQIAMYFKHHKPKSKVVILDTKDRFSKQALFKQGWAQHYGDMVEWVSGAEGGIIEGVDAKNMTLIGEVDEYKGDVVNVIPPQKAGHIAHVAGLTDDSGWCPVDQKTFESTIHQDIHVIGDACKAGKMPKSGYAANSQGKVCAKAIIAHLNGTSVEEPSYVNTCYSIVAHDHGFSVAAVYQLQNGVIMPVKGAGGLSPIDASKRTRANEVQYALGWYKNITSDMFK
ncbi:MAG: FAD-dependent oxidoreductase [Gammaproteobacteria bacterium]|nr:FAD-dependent oxidoreductase [Gammaproteobacteria bacterium]